MEPEVTVVRASGWSRATRRSVAVLALFVLVVTACGSRLPDEVLADIDEATLGASGEVTSGTGGRSSSAEHGEVAAGDGSSGVDGGEARTTNGATSGPTNVDPTRSGDEDGTSPAAGSDPECRGGATDVGVTEDEIKVASIVTASGPLPGATEGGYRGAAAYLAKVNAEGGVCGRKITLLKGDDGLDPQRARAEFLRLEPEVLAFVGPFAVADSGYIDLIEKTGVPYVGTSVDPAGRQLPSVVPHVAEDVSHSGPYEYYRQTHPGVKDVGFLYADVGGVRDNIPVPLKGFETAGFDIVYNSGVNATQPDFTADVINLRRAGTQLLYLFAFEVNMHVRLARNMRQQNWEPEVKVSNIGYNSKLIELLGDIANGWSNHLNYLPVINEDEPARSPAVAEFLSWHERIAPGASIDLFPVTTWGDAARFVEALRQAGPDVTRQKIIEIIDNLPESDGGGIYAPTAPAQRRGTECVVIARVENARWVREHPASGFECGMGEPYRY